MFETLDKLPKPDLIIASPPCERWSVASALKNGNACWKREDISDSLFEPQKTPSPFTIRSKRDYEESHNNLKYHMLIHHIYMRLGSPSTIQTKWTTPNMLNY